MLRFRKNRIIFGCILFSIASLFFLIQPKQNIERIISREPRKVSFEKDLPIIYIITGTYPRPEQLPELVRLSQTLLHVKNVLWIVCEEARLPTENVRQFLKETRVRNVYLRVPKPLKYIDEYMKSRGGANKNLGLEWVRKNAKSGVVFFADDDNVYDLRLFEDMRSTRKISMFPVGLLPIGRSGVDTPIVKNGVVVGYYTGWDGGRMYPLDFGEFAVNVQHLLERPDAVIPLWNGYEEDYFLQGLQVDMWDIELKAENCTKVWVWHTQTDKIKRIDPGSIHWAPKYDNSNLPMIKKQIY